MSYSIQARPYGLLLGLSALAMLSWQTATRRDSRRTLALVILSLSVAMAVNTQYYGVLLFIPLCAAESIRVLERRRADVSVLVSIFAGMGGLIVAMPFAKALSQFSAGHQPTEFNYHFITHSYLWLMFGYDAVSIHIQRLIGFGLALLLIFLMAGFAGLRSRVALRLPSCRGRFCSYPFGISNPGLPASQVCYALCGVALHTTCNNWHNSHSCRLDVISA